MLYIYIHIYIYTYIYIYCTQNQSESYTSPCSYDIICSFFKCPGCGFVSVTEAHIHDRCHALSLDLPGRSGTCQVTETLSGDPHGDVPEKNFGKL